MRRLVSTRRTSVGLMVLMAAVAVILLLPLGFHRHFLPSLSALLTIGRLTVSSDFVTSPDGELQAQFLSHLNDLPVVKNKLLRVHCEKGQEFPCLQAPCNASFPPAETRLADLLGSQYPLQQRHRLAVDQLTDSTAYADIVFVVGASANHYQEYLGVFNGLFTQIFPRLRREARYSYKLVCYDLGLTKAMVEKMDKFCASVVRFPFELLPPSFAGVHRFQWKPLVIAANVFRSKVTIWMDASVRFTTDNLDPVLAHTLSRGVFITKSDHQLPSHVAALTLRYFGVQPCLLSAFREMQSGFLGLRNDVVTRRGVLGPWVACAFSPNCLRPAFPTGKGCNHSIPGPYSHCHRYDQSALAVILVKLYGWRASSFYGNRNIFTFDRRRFYGFSEMNI